MELNDRYAAIDVVGIDEQIRCEMCRNPMHTDRGCDGGCTYDEKLYKRIMQILDERIRPLPSVQPEIIRCEDCRFAKQYDAWWCERLTGTFKVPPDGYCNFGKRKLKTN